MASTTAVVVTASATDFVATCATVGASGMVVRDLDAPVRDAGSTAAAKVVPGGLRRIYRSNPGASHTPPPFQMSPADRP